MDPYAIQDAGLTISLVDIGIGEQDTYQMHELIQYYSHNGMWAEYIIRLDPSSEVVAIFEIQC